jgi:CheY-like chemotaxis protein
MLAGVRVLVVEDNDESRKVLRLTLEAAGATVVTAGKAGDALAALAAARFDVVVSDLAMPEQSGFWLISRIRGSPAGRHLPVVAVTGHPFPLQGILRAGFDAVIQKPPDPDRLCATLGRLARGEGGGTPNTVVT